VACYLGCVDVGVEDLIQVQMGMRSIERLRMVCRRITITIIAM
jgi:hypothetical protein